MPDPTVGLSGLKLAKARRSKRYKALIGLVVDGIRPMFP
jgi:hypothetical protein